MASGYNVSSFELWNERKPTLQWDFRVINDTFLYQVRAYHEIVYVDNVVSIFLIVRPFSSQHQHKFLANIATEIMAQVRTKKCKTRSFIRGVNLCFLRSSR